MLTDVSKHTLARKLETLKRASKQHYPSAITVNCWGVAKFLLYLALQFLKTIPNAKSWNFKSLLKSKILNNVYQSMFLEPSPSAPLSLQMQISWPTPRSMEWETVGSFQDFAPLRFLFSSPPSSSIFVYSKIWGYFP